MKSIFLALALIVTFLLGACATTPPPVIPGRLPSMSYSDPDQSAYLWTTGLTRLRLESFIPRENLASVTQINGDNLPTQYQNTDNSERFILYSWLLEVPVKEHAIKILRRYLAHWYRSRHDFSRHTLTFTPEPNRTYAPFASDVCSRIWIWIEDLGPYVPGSETRSDPGYAQESKLKKPVVAGTPPPKDTWSCPYVAPQPMRGRTN